MGFLKSFRRRMKQAAVQTNRIGVYIAIPSVNGNVPAQIVRMIAQALQFNMDPSCPFFFKWGIMRGIKPIEFARNLLVRDFLRGECQILYFVDADTIPSDNWPELLQIPGDIVAGAYLQYDEDLETGISLKLLAYRRSKRPENLGWDTIMPGKEPEDIDAAGTGCMVIHRRVFEDERMLLPTKYTDCMGNDHDLNDEKDNHDWAPPFFPALYKPNGQLMNTEDLPFCQRAKDLGYKVIFVPGVMFGHLKTVNLNDIARLVVQKATEAVARGTVEPKPWEEQMAEAAERRQRQKEHFLRGAAQKEEDGSDAGETQEENGTGGEDAARAQA